MGDDEVEVGESEEELGGASANGSTRWQRIRPELKITGCRGGRSTTGEMLRMHL